ncbi:agmatinase [Psychrosphaera saromensis]|uniref:agmatinase family protein n=1 Tax=Psychrosphaera saromensis TaxID=716813 RepID=UPI000CF549D6|nr:agmatinase family protein [Psychrosphaera saromensis]GHB74868.1 agmatinase [Psychrosphaera saromensis]GLQ12664.1 agmatinase [Psychrosphaera saromensis]
MDLIKAINLDLTPSDVVFECALEHTGIFKNTIHIVGFEFDGTACFRKGTKDGPNALRAVSDGIESYSPYLDDDIDGVSFVDLGNFSLFSPDSAPMSADDLKSASPEFIQALWQKGTDDFIKLFSDVKLEQDQVKVITLGGEHSISYAPIKTYLEQYDDLALVHLDAHADLRDGYLGYHYSHASIIRRVVDHFGPKHELIQYGIRSGTKDEYVWMNENNSLIKDRTSFLKKIESIPNDRPIYLTLDLDYFDPSFFPGTGTPEPGGEDFHSFISLCKILTTKNFVGCDVVELAPNIDASGNSDVFAAKVVRELILCLNRSGNNSSSNNNGGAVNNAE